MARSIRSSQLETRSARLRLPVAKKPIFVRIGPGLSLGYRRNKTSGTWVIRISDGKGGNSTKVIGVADDLEDANGIGVLNYWEAQDKARSFGRSDIVGDSGSAMLMTVDDGLDRLEADLKTRNGDVGNVARVRCHLPAALRKKPVVMLTGKELRRWRDSLKNKGLSLSTVNRTITGLRAALNLAAKECEAITNISAWRFGLAAFDDAEESNNVILPEPVVRHIVGMAGNDSQEFGLHTEVGAVTGARPSQIRRLQVQDLQSDVTTPRLMMPSARKGRAKKVIRRRPVPIGKALALKLQPVAAGRPASAPLLRKPSGGPWKKNDHVKPFARTVKAAGLDPSVTYYALRHSSIVRQILSGVPIRVVAVNHDTSVRMIEKTYSRHIGDHADALVRKALLDIDDSAANGAVVPLRH